MLRQLLLQVRHSPAQVGVGLGISCAFRLSQAGDDIGGHEDAAGILLPPAPAAIVVLQVVQAVEAGVNLGLQIRRAYQAG